MAKNELADHPQDIQRYLREKLCPYLPDAYQSTCEFVVTEFEPLLIELIKQHASASKICNQFKYFQCDGCSLDGLVSDTGFAAGSDELFKVLDNLHKLSFFFHLTEDRNNKLENKRANDIREYLPLLDTDKDYFSPIHTMFRGADWRGMDCDDSRDNVRPGLMKDESALSDSNCNGISGVDSQGRLYEDLFCHSVEESQSSLKQVVMFGDSASSHFHIPAEWFHLQNISKILSALNELDWPEKSWGTGFINDIDGESIYLRMRRKNRCIHRGYQNVGHNGARAKDFVEQITALSPPQPGEKPYLAMMAYIGNDVCKKHPKDITTDADFVAQITQGLEKLDSVAPPGSKLLTMGLVDATILWDEMWNRTHPLGVSYANVYEFLQCATSNPCNTYLTSNATMRAYSRQRSLRLSQLLQETTQQYQGKLKNIDLDYMDFPLQKALNYVKSVGVSPALLIEPVDGFHPSGYAHRIFSRFVWEFMESKHPDWIGVDNQFNSEITTIFGDQGGH